MAFNNLRHVFDQTIHNCETVTVSRALDSSMNTNEVLNTYSLIVIK